VDGDAPVIDRASPLAQLLGHDIASVTPQFDVRVTRQVWTLAQENGTVEVSLDRGLIVAGARSKRLLELELELKSGEPGALFAAARNLSDRVSFRFGVLSKSERGARLLGGTQRAYQAQSVSLDRSMSVPFSLQTIAFACFRHFRLNESLLLAHRNPEALHQSRVAIRRRRAALAMYKPILADDIATRLRIELAWLGSELGAARDIDVLMGNCPGQVIRQTLATSRDRAYDGLFDALRSARSSHLWLDFNEWLRCGAYLHHSQSKDARCSVAEFAMKALDRLRKKLKRHGQLANADDARRHLARKDAKKLRYGGEFFGSVFAEQEGHRRYDRFVAAMEALQDRLGELNDIAGAKELLKGFGLPDYPQDSDLAEREDRIRMISAAQKALDEVIDLKTFWR
jgi:inorganic triphosphatase YgiF